MNKRGSQIATPSTDRNYIQENMEEKELVQKAKSIPYHRWWEIESLIEDAGSDELKDKLYWIMREKELREQLSV